MNYYSHLISGHGYCGTSRCAGLYIFSTVFPGLSRVSSNHFLVFRLSIFENLFRALIQVLLRCSFILQLNNNKINTSLRKVYKNKN